MNIVFSPNINYANGTSTQFQYDQYDQKYLQVKFAYRTIDFIK
jgi:hypothetical protein